uniref:Uncharacterized protein n=1 Tax=Anopheles gambiae TaxID=7165 RepID=A0A0E3W2D5_ANOGA
MAGHSGQKHGLSFLPIRSDDDVTTSRMGWTLRFQKHTLGSTLPVRLDTRDHGALGNTEHGSYTARPLRSNNDATTLSTVRLSSLEPPMLRPRGSAGRRFRLLRLQRGIFQAFQLVLLATSGVYATERGIVP